MRKRYLTIITSSIVLIGSIAGITWLVFNDSNELVTSDDPFNGLGSGLFEGEGLPEASSGAGTAFAPRLVRITDKPVSEGVVAITRTSTSTNAIETQTGITTSTTSTLTPSSLSQDGLKKEAEVRFIDRASGNIYRYLAQERSLTRLSNKTLPGIQRASWLSDGSKAYVQFLTGDQGSEYVATYVLPDTGEGGFFLEQNLAAAKAVDMTTLFTQFSGSTGSVGSLAKDDATGAKTLFNSLLSSLVVHPTSGSFYAHTKASITLDGYAFQIRRSDGSFSRLLGPMRGLSVLPSPAGDRVLYSYLDRGVLRLSVLDVESRAITPLPVTTLSEKCAWAPNGLALYCGVPQGLGRNLPDEWYQGATAFSDRLWKIDITDRLATLVVDPQAVAELSLDTFALAVDPSEDALFFTDKRTGSLWAYDL